MNFSNSLILEKLLYSLQLRRLLVPSITQMKRWKASGGKEVPQISILDSIERKSSHCPNLQNVHLGFNFPKRIHQIPISYLNGLSTSWLKSSSFVREKHGPWLSFFSPRFWTHDEKSEPFTLWSSLTMWKSRDKAHSKLFFHTKVILRSLSF